jgi:hypothetical protein
VGEDGEAEEGYYVGVRDEIAVFDPWLGLVCLMLKRRNEMVTLRLVLVGGWCCGWATVSSCGAKFWQAPICLTRSGDRVYVAQWLLLMIWTAFELGGLMSAGPHSWN